MVHDLQRALGVQLRRHRGPVDGRCRGRLHCRRRVHLGATGKHGHAGELAAVASWYRSNEAPPADALDEQMLGQRRQTPLPPCCRPARLERSCYKAKQADVGSPAARRQPQPSDGPHYGAAAGWRLGPAPLRPPERGARRPKPPQGPPAMYERGH